MRAFPPTAAGTGRDLEAKPVPAGAGRCSLVRGGVGPNHKGQICPKGSPRRVLPAPPRQPTPPRIPTQCNVATGTGAETGATTGGTGPLPQGGSSLGGPVVPRVLLPPIRSTQSIGRVAPGHRSQGSKSLRVCSALSDAYRSICAKYRIRRRLGFHSRPNRCIPSRAHPQGEPEIPEVLHRRASAAVSSTTIWAEHCPPPVHTSSERGGGVLTSAGGVSDSIPGRLASPSPVPRDPPASSTTSPQDTRQAWPASELGEVSPPTYPRPAVSRGAVPPQGGYCTPTAREGKSDSGPCHRDRSTDTLDLPPGLVADGFPQLGGFLDTIGASGFTAPPTVSQSSGTVRATDTLSCTPTEGRSVSAPVSSQPMAEPSVPFPGHPHPPLPSGTGAPHGCIGTWMGSTPWGPPSSWHLGPFGAWPSYQHLGTPGSAPGSPSVSWSSGGSPDLGILRQHLSGGLHQPPRGYPLGHLTSGGVRPSTVVSLPAHSASCTSHSGPPECDSRCPITITPGHPDGVAVTPTSGQEGVPVVGHPSPRSVCHQAQHTTSKVCVTSARPTSPGSGCPLPAVAGNVGICVPSTSTSCPSSDESLGRRSRDDTNRPTLASSAMVSTASGPPLRLATSTTTTTRLVVAGQYSKLGRTVPSARMATVTAHLRERAGFSEKAATFIAAPTRASTARAYDGRWARWADWAEGRGLDPVTASVTDIADFFVQLFEEGLTPATIKGYRTSISSVLSKLGRRNVISDTSLSDMLSSMAINRPAKTRIVPSWELGLVLRLLKEKPYEPMKDSDLKHLTLKTVFLVTMASGGRRSEVQALMFDETYCKIELDGSKATLHFAPDFLRKNRSPFSAETPVVIQALPTGHREFGAPLCPVRALRYYRRATSSPDVRKDRKRLFVPFKDNNQGKEISPMSISRWIVSVIAEAYQEQGENQAIIRDLGIRAHEVRAVATSLVSLQGASLDEVMTAGRWASGGTFTRHYLRDMVPQATQIAKAGPIVAAGKVINLPPPVTTCS